MAQYVQAYTSLDDIKLRKGIVNDTDDDLIIHLIYRASDMIASYCARVFEPYLQTRYQDLLNRRLIDLDEDLLSLTSLSDFNGVVSASAYTTYPYNQTPASRILLTDNSTYLAYNTTTLKALTLVGTWGFHLNFARAWESVTTLSQAISTTTQTTIHLTSTQQTPVLSLIKIGDEYLRISNHTASSTVKRGQNGTTAATYPQGTAVSVWHVQDVIKEVCEELVIYLYDNRDRAGGETVQFVDGGVLVSQQSAARIKLALNRFVKMDMRTVGYGTN